MVLLNRATITACLLGLLMFHLASHASATILWFHDEDYSSVYDEQSAYDIYEQYASGDTISLGTGYSTLLGPEATEDFSFRYDLTDPSSAMSFDVRIDDVTDTFGSGLDAILNFEFFNADGDPIGLLSRDLQTETLQQQNVDEILIIPDNQVDQVLLDDPRCNSRPWATCFAPTTDAGSTGTGEGDIDPVLNPFAPVVYQYGFASLFDDIASVAVSGTLMTYSWGIQDFSISGYTPQSFDNSAFIVEETEPVSVPEPGALLIFSIGLFVLLGVRYLNNWNEAYLLQRLRRAQ